MPNVAVARHESALGEWSVACWKPEPGSLLADAVDQVWHFDGTLGAARERVFPNGTLELIVHLDTPHRPGDDRTAPRFPPLCVSGILTTAEVVEAPLDRCRVLGVRLQPPAASRLLRTSLVPLTSLTLDLGDLLDAAAAELATRVRDAADGTRAVIAAAAWVERHIAPQPEPDSTVARALAAIRDDGGTRSIAAIDAWHGRSRARFNAAFRDAVGVSPKRFARIVRFDRALQLMTCGHGSFGEIALAAGYYDQPHFNAEFRAHAGLTPRAYISGLRFPGSTSLADPAEQNFQDTAS
jgi:AraC-like DNA-binding protein